jgi:hypothetical protein
MRSVEEGESRDRAKKGKDGGNGLNDLQEFHHATSLKGG